MTLKEQILDLRRQNKTYAEIAEKLGCSKSTVCYYVAPGQNGKKASRQRKDRQEVAMFIQAYKQENPCTDCGINYPYYVMDFDHLPEFEKAFGIGATAQSLAKVKEEIEKCELVCSNCHRTRTFNRAQSSLEDVAVA